MLNYAPENIRFPQKVYLWGSKDGVDFDLLSIRNSSYFPNDLHDAWIDGIWFEKLDKNIRFIKIAFNAEEKIYLDEIYINPIILKNQ